MTGTLLPPSIPGGDDLVAMCTPRGWASGDVCWQSEIAKHTPPLGAEFKMKPGDVRRPAMTYRMRHWAATRNNHRVIEGICITNLYCGPGNGWDVIVLDSIVAHCDRKTEAQAEAEKLLDGKC